MTPEDVKKMFKNGYIFHKKTGMSHASFGNWMRQGYVPEYSQLKLEKITRGALRAQISYDGEDQGGDSEK